MQRVRGIWKRQTQVTGCEMGQKEYAGYFFLKYNPAFQSFLGNVYFRINTTNYFNCTVNISINFLV